MLARPRLSFESDTKIFIWVGIVVETDTTPEQNFKICVVARDLPEAFRKLDDIKLPPGIRARVRAQDPDVFAAPFVELTVKQPKGKGFTVCHAQRLGTASGLNYSAVDRRSNVGPGDS